MQSGVKDLQNHKKLNLEFDYKKNAKIDSTMRSNSATFINSPLKLINNNKPTPASSTKTLPKNNDYLKVKIEITENNNKDSMTDNKNSYQK